MNRKRETQRCHCKRTEAFLSLTFLTMTLCAVCNLFGFELLQIVPDAAQQGQSTLYQQPAKIALSRRKHVNFFYSNWYYDAKVSNFGIVLPLRNIVTSLDYSLLTLEDTYRTSTDETTRKIGFSNNIVSFGLGALVSDMLSFGTSLKFARQEISWADNSLKDSIVAFDFGFIYTNFKLKQCLGIALHNFLISGKTDKPYETVSVSGSQKIDPITFNWGVYLTSPGTESSRIKAGFGLEYPVVNYFKLRAGIRYQNLVSFSGGFSVRVKSFVLDYGILHHIDLGQTHNFSVGIYF